MLYNIAMLTQLGSGPGRSDFASTQWSMVLAAKGDGASVAMADLCAAYWRPLYAYVRRSGRSVEDAQDLAQSFFSRVLEKNYLQHVDQALGKFRAFLLASLKNFMTNEWRRENTAKRGGSARMRP
jgi:DNA-directed RNA polymerase specialized sigma24 family protein